MTTRQRGRVVLVLAGLAAAAVCPDRLPNNRTLANLGGGWVVNWACH